MRVTLKENIHYCNVQFSERFEFLYSKIEPSLTAIPRGLMARIPGFHPGGPGSIPGVGEQLLFFFGKKIFKIVQNIEEEFVEKL